MVLLKKILLTICSVLAIDCAFGQAGNDVDYKRFAFSLGRSVRVLTYNQGKCNSNVGLIKVETDNNLHIVSMTLSDSIDSLQRTEFEKGKANADITSLEQYLKSTFPQGKYTVFFIPVSYSLINMPCPQQGISISSFASYYKFNGRQINAPITLLSPLDYKNSIQH